MLLVGKSKWQTITVMNEKKKLYSITAWMWKFLLDSHGFTVTLHCNKTLGRILPPWLDGTGPNGQGRETFCPSPMLVFYIPPWRKTFQNFPAIYPVKTRKSVSRKDQTQVLILSYPETMVTLHESSKYEILSHPLKFLLAGNISDMEVCKIPAWARDKCSGINRGLFHFQNCNFPEESLILLSCC
jgi:hypothetical protein